MNKITFFEFVRLVFDTGVTGILEDELDGARRRTSFNKIH
jgi:hypothetical protein